MNIDQLKAFHKVASTGSFTRAAKELFLTQSAVSQQVQSLEYFLGNTLFDRVGKKVYLTGEGKILLSYTNKMFDLYKEIETVCANLRGLQKGRITIGATAVLGTYFLPRIIGHYNKKYPGIEIDLRMGNSRKILNMTLEGEVDMGFTGRLLTVNKLKSVLIHRDKMLMVSSSQSSLADKKSISVNELDKMPFIWREKGTQTRMLIEKWFYKNVSRNYPLVSIELENVEAVKRLVSEGYGVTIIPETAAKKEIEAGLLKPLNLEGFDLSIDYYLLYLEGKTLSKAAKAFLEIISDIQLFSHAKNLNSYL